MKNKKNKVILILIVGIIVNVSVCCALVSALKTYSGKFFNNPLKNIQEDTVEKPNYVIYDALYSKYGKVDIDTICKKQNRNYDMQEIFCVSGKKVYFIYTDYSDEKLVWKIASVDLEKNKFQDLCQIEDAACKYSDNMVGNYKERNGYYLDDTIVLNDQKSVLTYNLKTKVVELFSYEEYQFPENERIYELINNETIYIEDEYLSGTYSLKEMAKDSSNIAKIYALKENTTVSGLPYLYDFFNENSVQYVDGELYLLGGCLNNIGESYAVILKYDSNKELWQYVTSMYVGDIVPSHCYIIP